MGEMTEEFDIPVCRSFRETIRQGQLCYQVDINSFKIGGRFSSEQLQLGLTLILDYNEDRQIFQSSSNEEEHSIIIDSILGNG